MTEAELKEAASLADRYNWPSQARQIRETGTAPKGFGHEVGCTIAVFLNHWPFGCTPDQEQEDRWHAKRLARLRVLVARMNIENREPINAENSMD